MTRYRVNKSININNSDNSRNSDGGADALLVYGVVGRVVRGVVGVVGGRGRWLRVVRILVRFVVDDGRQFLCHRLRSGFSVYGRKVGIWCSTVSRFYELKYNK